LGQRGFDLATVYSRVQDALHVLSNWCAKVGLSINPTKTESILFTLKNKYSIPRKLTLNGVPILECKHVRYLGVWLDTKLNWSYHCTQKCNKMMIALMQCRRAVGNTWGLTPRVMRWIFTAVIRPSLMYGVLCWLPMLEKITCLKTIERVQRVALRMIAGVAKSTPLAALECLLGVLPIRTYAQNLAIKTLHRLKQTGSFVGLIQKGKLKRWLHVGLCERVSKDISELILPCDYPKNRNYEEINFEICVKSREKWREEGEPAHVLADIVCYTESSIRNDNMGGSYFVMYEGEWVHEGITLGTQCTLFQAEVISISHAASEILQTWNGNRRVFIYTHNLSVISAIQSIWQASELVSECRDNLNNLARTHQLTLSWIPAGFHGNEMAHQIASEAANIDFVGPLPTIPISLGSVHEAIDKWSQARHTLVWNRGIDCAMTKRRGH